MISEPRTKLIYAFKNSLFGLPIYVYEWQERIRTVVGSNCHVGHQIRRCDRCNFVNFDLNRLKFVQKLNGIFCQFIVPILSIFKIE